MTLFRPKEYLSPTSSEQAIGILTENGSKARILAGGTAFYELAKRGMMPEVQQIVDLRKLHLDFAKVNDEDKISIGSMITLTDLLNSGVSDRQGSEALRDFLVNFTPIQIRNLATAGGEICSGIPFLDLPVVALALGAEFKIVGPQGLRTIPAESFFLDYFLVDLRKGEYLSEILIPKMPMKVGSAFMNLKRTAADLSVVNTAVKVRTSDNDSFAEIVIALGGVAQIPLRLHNIEKSLVGKRMDDSIISKTLGALDELTPIPSIHASPWYKKEVCKVIVRDAIKRAWERAQVGAS